MKRWACTLKIEEFGTTTSLTLVIHADTEAEANEIAFNHFAHYADEAVAHSAPDCLNIPILTDTKLMLLD